MLIGSGLAAGRAHAEPPCRALLAPASLSVRDTGIDQNRAACAADGYSLGARALAIIDTPAFYGTLSASLFGQYRWLSAAGYEFSVGARIVDYRFAQSAVFTDAELALGPLSVSALRPRATTLWGRAAVIAHSMRFELPLSNSSDENLKVTASPAYLLTLMASDSLHVHGRVAGLLWSNLADSGVDARAALLASADLAYVPLSAISLLVGADVQGGWYGLGLDHVLPRVGMRVAIGDEGAVEVSAGSALLGSERTDLVFWFGYRSMEEPEVKRSRLQDWAH